MTADENKNHPRELYFGTCPFLFKFWHKLLRCFRITGIKFHEDWSNGLALRVFYLTPCQFTKEKIYLLVFSFKLVNLCPFSFRFWHKVTRCLIITGIKFIEDWSDSFALKIGWKKPLGAGGPDLGKSYALASIRVELGLSSAIW